MAAAIEVDFEVAAPAISVAIISTISAIIAIIINVRDARLPGLWCLPHPFTPLPPLFLYYCYGAITVSAINFPFCWSTTCITNAGRTEDAAMSSTPIPAATPIPTPLSVLAKAAA